MGGHTSKQSVTESTNIVSSVTQKVTQNCVTAVNSSNVVVIDGNGNILSGVDQELSVSVDSHCVAQVTQDAAFNADLKNAAVQATNTETISGLGWLDCGKDDSATTITNNVSSTTTSETVQNCLNSVQGKNLINITGNQNVLQNVLQKNTIQMFSKCVLGNAQQTSTVNDTTNTANQQSTYTAKNPFAFITDAFEATVKSVAMMIAIVFIVLICLGAIVMALTTSGKNKDLPDFTPAAAY